jgi:hypothetical protein
LLLVGLLSGLPKDQKKCQNSVRGVNLEMIGGWKDKLFDEWLIAAENQIIALRIMAVDGPQHTLFIQLLNLAGDFQKPCV